MLLFLFVKEQVLQIESRAMCKDGNVISFLEAIQLATIARNNYCELTLIRTYYEIFLMCY